MNKKLGINDRANSQAAINAYISYREENGYRHKARVLISSKGKELYSNILYVCAVTDASNFYMIVEGDNKFSHNFHGRYGHEYNRFSFIRGTLIIHSTDIWGNAIELSISSVVYGNLKMQLMAVKNTKSNCQYKPNNIPY